MAKREPIRELQAWILEHPTADLSADVLDSHGPRPR
jgi:hypothetical protein